MSELAAGSAMVDGRLQRLDTAPMFLTGFEDPALTARIVSAYPLPGVRAGSALLRRGDSLLAVQDDAWSVAWIALPELAVALQVLHGDGAALPKKRKPDFEAAILAADGAVHLFGSGSRANRCVVARIAADRATVELREMPGLYAAIAQALHLDGPPNIEAALVHGDRLRLFHRGAAAAPSASVDLALATLHGAPPEILASQRYRPGSLDGVALHITDAANLEGGRTAFLAAAEHTDDAIADGPVAGSVIGLIETVAPQPRLRWARLIDADGRPSRRKAEGLVMDDDGRGAWVLTDPDSTEHPAELCRVTLAGFA